MANTVVGINGKILIWARERAGLTLAQAAHALGRSPETIARWENGEESPTYPQLEDLAYRVYKRPLALFFFPEPPDEPDPEQSFRTLPDFEIADLSPDTRYKIRQARAMQLSLYELHDGANPAPHKVFRDLNARGMTAARAAANVREYLGIDLDTQRHGWRSTDDAVKGWRKAVEESGIYVFKDTFKQKDVSGFCLYDQEFPVIYVNNSTAKARQIFTILHELAHILLATNGVTKRDERYINTLTGDSKAIETFCNRFAAECLLPTSIVKAELSEVTDEGIAQLASTYKVSRQVVLTRLVTLGEISQERYEQKAAQWKADYDAQPKREGGGNYYLTHGAYLGERFLRLAFTRYYEGRISLERLADVLNVKVDSVAGLEQVALQGPP